MWQLDYKESWAPKNWCFWTVGLEKTLENPLDFKEIKTVQSLLKEISPEYSLEGLMLKLKLQYFGHLMQRTDSLDCSTPDFLVHHQLPELAHTHVHQVGDSSNHLILCHPFILLPSIFPTISVFSSESVFHIRWPKYWSFSFSISPSSEYSGIISFRADCWISLQSKGLSRIFSSINWGNSSATLPREFIELVHCLS